MDVYHPLIQALVLTKTKCGRDLAWRLIHDTRQLQVWYFYSFTCSDKWGLPELGNNIMKRV